MIRSSGESLSEDITLKAREFAQRSKILRGRQISLMIIDYFKTNRSLQEQYTWQDIEARQWQGDEKLQWFYTRWKLITTSLSITISDIIPRDIFFSKSRNSNKLQVDIVDFDRMREDDSRRNLKWLTESIDRLLAGDRME